jgi:hypothetical protein
LSAAFTGMSRFYQSLRVLKLDGLFNAFGVPRQIRERLLNHGDEKFKIVFATIALLEKGLQFSPIK